MEGEPVGTVIKIAVLEGPCGVWEGLRVGFDAVLLKMGSPRRETF